MIIRNLEPNRVRFRNKIDVKHNKNKVKEMR